MAKVPIHFIGFLANVDDSITALQLNDGFRIERKAQAEVMAFLDSVEKSYGNNESFRLIAFDSDGRPRGCYCIMKRDVDRFEATSRGRMIVKSATGRTVHSQAEEKLRLLRLFKEGNIVMPYACLYRDLPDGKPEIPTLVRVYPLWDRTPFTLESKELEETQKFLATHSLPPREKHVQLAFEGFELSYEVHDIGVAFLQLMIAMEVMLHPGDRDELRYRISRNAGVLLGQDRGDAERVYKEVRELYDKRSKLVHAGDKSVITREDVLKLRHYVRETIKEAMKSGMSKGELLNTLNACGFGERPWRNGK